MIAPADPLILDWFEGTYRPARLLGRAETTRQRYHCVLRQFARALGRQPHLSDLSERAVQRFMAWYLERGVEKITVNTARSHLMALARYAQSQGELDRVPDVAKLPEDRRVPEAWTVEQLAHLLVACRGCRGALSGIPARLYWEAAVRILYDTGLRCGALWQLRESDVRLQDASILVPPEIQKQRAGQLVRFSRQQTLPIVRAIWLPERELLFPWELHWSTRYNHFNRLLIAAGLPHGRRDKFHRIRRTHASYVHAAGGDATASLGHSSPAVTRSYLDPRICGAQRAVDLLPQPDGAVSSSAT